jgi:hypothetical protein
MPARRATVTAMARHDMRRIIDIFVAQIKSDDFVTVGVDADM